MAEKVSLIASVLEAVLSVSTGKNFMSILIIVILQN